MMTFKSMELTFCVKPNIIACAAIEISFGKIVDQGYFKHKNFTVMPTYEFLKIPEHKNSILDIKGKLQAILNEQENKG